MLGQQVDVADSRSEPSPARFVGFDGGNQAIHGTAVLAGGYHRWHVQEH